MRSVPLLLFALSGVSFVAGYASRSLPGVAESPVTGVWSGKLTINSSKQTYPTQLTLRPHNTGYMKTLSPSEQLIRWDVDEDRILLGASTAAMKNPRESDETIVGKLSDDKKTLTFEWGGAQFVLNKTN